MKHSSQYPPSEENTYSAAVDLLASELSEPLRAIEEIACYLEDTFQDRCSSARQWLRQVHQLVREVEELLANATRQHTANL